ncbi:hypothetical protein [Aureibacter tunicatorum]|uniref:Uncharacterized protein n=1 Tax=Aureibacter tunicatorum TaxID=866807 RepID=A0AAE3XK91_9BACT|nr:hypothetical protein [Aureibacter tunicatorum]MDR6238173.1 hypothetical protein [Aureibacter tunicatorum]
MRNPNSLIILKIEESYVKNTDYRAVLCDVRFESEILFTQIFSSLEKMYTQFGLVGYKMAWEVGNFPVAEFLILKAWLFDFNLDAEKCCEVDEWRRKVSSNKEFELLNMKS